MRNTHWHEVFDALPYGWSIRMSAATLMRPEAAVWSGYPPVGLRFGNATANRAPASTATYYNQQVNDALRAERNAGVTTEPNSELAALIGFLMDFLTEAAAAATDSDGSDDTPDTSPASMLTSFFPQAAQTGSSAPAGDANVGPIGGGNPAGIAQGLVGQWASSLQANQQVPMDRSTATDVCCANFVSGCLQKAGLLSSSEHTVSAPQLKTTLQKKGWHLVSRSQAKPGDVCFKLDGGGTPEHVELVAKNNGGSITLIGSNNTGANYDGPQKVSYDGGTGNKGDVVFLSRS
jgi:hypothetical protein